MRNLLLTLALVSAALHPGMAAAATGDWFTSDGVKLRLVSQRDGLTGKLSAALQIVLEPGWKTYWRSPGSSGLPPQLDFSQSQNISGAVIKYPSPIAFGEGANLTSGYKDEVILPIDVQVPFPQKDVVLKVRGLIGVCEEICIPMQFSTELTDKTAGGSSIQASQVLLRGKATLPGNATDNARILSVTPGDDGLIAIASVPEGTKEAALFLEGPSRWYLAPVKPEKIENGVAYFAVKLPKKISPADTSGKTLRATFVVDGKGIEQDVKIR